MATRLGKVSVEITANAAAAMKSINDFKTKVATNCKAMSDKYKSVNQSLQGVSRVGRQAFLALGATMTAAVYSSAKFAQEMANVSTMLGSEAMPRMDEFRSGIEDMAVAMGEGTDTLSKGLYDILSASIEPAKAMDVLEVSAKAAAAGLTDTGTAADAVTTMINAFGLKAEDAGLVSDKLFNIVKRGKTTFAELAPTIGLAATTAHQAGLSMDEMGASLATATRSGIKTRVAVTSLRSVMKSFTGATDLQKEAAAKYNIELTTQTLKTEGLLGVAKKLAGATAEDVAAIFQNQRARALLNSILGDQKGFLEDVTVHMKKAGSAEEAYAKQTDNLNFQLKQLKESGTRLLRTYGDILTTGGQSSNMIEKLTANINDLSKRLASLGPAGQTAIKAISGTGLSLAALAATLSVTGAALAAVRVGFAGMSTAMKAASGLAGIMVAEYTVLNQVVERVWGDKARTAIEGMNAALKKNEIEAARLIEQINKLHGITVTKGEDANKVLESMAGKLTEIGIKTEDVTKDMANLGGGMEALRGALETALEGTEYQVNIVAGKTAITKIKEDVQAALESAEEEAAKKLGGNFGIQLRSSGELQSALGDAFRDSLNTGSFIDFEATLRQSIYDHVKSSLIDAFLNTTVSQQIIKPLINTINEFKFDFESGEAFNMPELTGQINIAVDKYKQLFPVIEQAISGLDTLNPAAINSANSVDNLGYQSEIAGNKTQEAGYKNQDAGYKAEGAGYKYEAAGDRAQQMGYDISTTSGMLASLAADFDLTAIGALDLAGKLGLLSTATLAAASTISTAGESTRADTHGRPLMPSDFGGTLADDRAYLAALGITGTGFPSIYGSGFMTGFARGTDYVPTTGPYILHQGEAVVPAAQNNPVTNNYPKSYEININALDPLGMEKVIKNQLIPLINEGRGRGWR